MSGCACPLQTDLGTVPVSTCDIQWDKINKMSLSRTQEFFSVTSGISSTVLEMQTFSEWATTLSVNDDTRAFITVPVGNWLAVPGPARTQDFDGNTTATGSYDPTTVTFDYQGISSAQLAIMRLLTCEPTLFAMFFDADGNIVHGLSGTTPTGFQLTAKTFTSTDMGQEELAGLIIAHGQLQLIDGWSSGTGVTITEPAFNPLLALVNS